jgi:hypothetical protein
MESILTTMKNLEEQLDDLKSAVGSFLEEQKAQTDWSDEEILSARASWTKLEKSKQELAGRNKPKRTASESASDAKMTAPEKPKRVLSDEQKQKQKMKEGRERAKALKAAAAPEAGVSSHAESTSSAEKKEGRPRAARTRSRSRR